MYARHITCPGMVGTSNLKGWKRGDKDENTIIGLGMGTNLSMTKFTMLCAKGNLTVSLNLFHTPFVIQISLRHDV